MAEAERRVDGRRSRTVERRGWRWALKALIDWAWSASIEDLVWGCVIAAFIASWIVSLFRHEK